MTLFRKNRTAARRVPAEVVALDLGAMGLKAVRLRKDKDGLTLLAADLLPAVKIAAEATAPGRLNLPRKMFTNYAALTLSSEKNMVRLITLPGYSEQDQNLAEKIQDIVKLEDSQRLAYLPIKTGGAKHDARILTVAVPEAEIQQVLALLPAGPPAPLSLEFSGLAALTAFFHGPGRQAAEEAVCFIDSGARTTFVAFLNRGEPVLVRTLELGGETLVEHLQAQWSLDRATALGALEKGATIDISQSVHELAAPFLRQVSISRDFVERQENCRITRVYLSGGMSMVWHWHNELKAAIGLEVQPWNPCEDLKLAPGAWPAALKGQEARFAAAVGAALGALDAS